jgi:hypothetical protein
MPFSSLDLESGLEPHIFIYSISKRLIPVLAVGLTGASTAAAVNSNHKSQHETY